MKIICIGMNYASHAKELQCDIPKEPVFFMKPDSALIKNNKPFFYPDFSKEIHYETEIVIRINRLGKSIAEKYAHRYYEEIGLGIDFTARDLQRKQIKKGLPWEIAKSFDCAAPIGKFLSKHIFPDLQNIDFSLKLNNKQAQKGNSSDMLFTFDQIIAYVSRFMTLKIGDVIFTGTPPGVGPVQINDRLKAYIENNLLLDFMVK